MFHQKNISVCNARVTLALTQWLWVLAAGLMFQFIFQGQVLAGSPKPPRCYPAKWNQHEILGDGRSIKTYNGYDSDSMIEISHADGRPFRWWLDWDNNTGAGRIRHTAATIACDGFAWFAHENFSNYWFAKELLVARDYEGSIVVAIINQDGMLALRMQDLSGRGPWGRWAFPYYPGFMNKDLRAKRLDQKDAGFSDLRVDGSSGDLVFIVTNKDGVQKRIKRLLSLERQSFQGIDYVVHWGF